MTTLYDSDRTVLAALAAGHKTVVAICDVTGMARRTAYTALRRLRDAGMLVERPYLLDTRMTIWSFAGVSRAPAAQGVFA